MQCDDDMWSSSLYTYRSIENNNRETDNEKGNENKKGQKESTHANLNDSLTK